MANILFILTGSISCYKACDAISTLVQGGHRVRTVATEAALNFVGRSTLEGLTRERVATDMFAAGEALDHIALTRWADVTAVCPATADFLNRTSAGLAGDLAGALLLAHDWSRPIVFFPAMNPRMAEHPATAASVRQLTAWGGAFVWGGAGRMACGESGAGRLAEPPEIVAALAARLQPPAVRRRILITTGGTAEPIDGVRVLTNTSSGATGAAIANALIAHGHEVVVLRAAQAIPVAGARQELFSSFADLAALLEQRLAEESFDVVIHAAAVGDFSVEAIEVGGVAWQPGRGKMPSHDAPSIRLRRNPKLLDRLREWSRHREVRIIAFKLTRDADPAAAKAAVMSLFASGAADYVVHNDLSTRQADGRFPAAIWDPAGTIVAECPDRAALASAVVQLAAAAPGSARLHPDVARAPAI